MGHVLKYIRRHPFLLFIILPAFFLYMLVIFPSGTFLCFKEACGIQFWGVHGHDAMWHLAIANVSFNKFPFVAPTFVGENLYGYNYLLDFFIFLFSKLGIPAIITYFKIFPVVWFILFTSLLIILGRKIKDSPLFVSLFLFFNYFAGSFYYLIKLYREHSINDSSTQLPQPIMLMMSNPPYAFSLLFLLWILILIKERNFNLKTSLAAGFAIFMIMGLKFYGRVIGIFLAGIYLTLQFLFKNFKRYLLFILFLGFFAFLSIIFFYNPTQSIKTGAVFGFAPFAIIHTITETPNQFYLQSMTDARYYLMSRGIGPRLIAIEALNLTIFLFFYLGTRFFGLLYITILLSKKKLDTFDFSVILTICFSIFLTATLVQKAEWWNTMQFFYYAIFLSTIYLSKLSFDLFQNKKAVVKLIVPIIMFLSVPTSYDLIKFFWAIPGATYLPREEMEALAFLKKQPDGVVYRPLYEKEWKNYSKSNPLYTYEDTAYLAAFSGKQEYLANELQLRLTGIPYPRRLEKVKKLDCSILSEVDYVYEIRDLPDEEKIIMKCKAPNIKQIYGNGKIIIYSTRES
ncbi:hypothetical protein HYW87_04620 [Candidatus Roizmanbacteria bacterium]|nr:hypothetical protein [Candidatus Roizmanbacteria bacterium]